MRTLTRLFLGVMVLATAAPAGAQVSVSLEKDYVMREQTMAVKVTLPAGVQVGRPRLATIREGQTLPGGGSKAWVEFPELTATQTISLRAPSAEGKWWLVMNDDRRLVARIPFDVVDWQVALQLKKAQLETAASQENNVAAQPPPAEPAPVRPDDSPLPENVSENGLVYRESGKPALRGRDVEITVALPEGIQPAEFLVRWRHAGTADAIRVTASGAAAARVSLIAPTGAGTYDVLLFYGTSLLDALPVVVE